LLRVELRGGKPQLLSSLDTGNAGRASGTWNREGTILFGLDTGRPIYQVAAAGGKVTEATVLSSEDRGHYRPFFLPDGNHFLFVTQAKGEMGGVYAGSLNAKETKRILDLSNSAAAYASGQLLFLRNGTLYAQNFDLKTLEVRDKPIQMADSVLSVGSSGAFSAFSVSETGVLAYRTVNSPETRGETQLTWFSRQGKVLSTLGRSGANRNPRLSRDGMRVAVEVNGGRGPTLWVLGPGDISTRVAENAAEPIWSSDGQRLLYSLRHPRTQAQIAQRVVGGQEQVLYAGTDSPEDVNDLSPDGKYVVGTTISGQTNRDLVAVPLDRSGKPQAIAAIAATAAQELYGRISPNGNWIAFSSDSTGVAEVYVQPFPQGGSKTLVSRNGGTWPVWRPDGKELFYIASDFKMMATSVSFTNGFQPGTPQPLFEVPLGLGRGIGSPSQYDVTSDGQSFLVAARSGNFQVSPIHIILNWTELLKR
jgi:Tol biopolymer transport system component